MPFKLFSSSKKAKKDKSVSKSVVDLSEHKYEEPPDSEVKAAPDSEVKAAPDSEVKASPKSKFHFFSRNSAKSSNHVHFKDADKNKKEKKNSFSLGQTKKTRSLSHIPSNAKEDAAHSADQSGKNRLHQDHQSTKPKGRTTRSASYGTFMDSLTRERLLLEIVQLDNYIEHLRHTEDEGNLTNRMCCAQVLKMGLIRIEMAHRHSQDRLNRAASLNGISQRPLNIANRTINKQAVASDLDSDHSDKKEDDSGSDSGAFDDNESVSPTGSEQDSGSEPDQENSCRVQESFSQLSYRTKDKKTPVWPRDIEIF